MALTKITGEGVGAVDSLTVQDDSTGIQPILFLKNDNTTDDNGMSIDFSGKDTSSNTVTYGRIDLRIPNHATEKSDMRFYTRNDSGVLTTQLQLTKDENAVFAGGLSMNGETAASNILDDYEEGTWTPQISATDGIGTLTYSTQVGHYTKIGNRIYFQMYVLVNNKGSVAGDIRYTLPFASANVSSLFSAASFWINTTESTGSFNGSDHIQAYIGPNSSIVIPQCLDGDGSVTGLSAGHIKNSTDVMISGHYRVYPHQPVGVGQVAAKRR